MSLNIKEREYKNPSEDESLRINEKVGKRERNRIIFSTIERNGKKQWDKENHKSKLKSKLYIILDRKFGRLR